MFNPNPLGLQWDLHGEILHICWTGIGGFILSSAASGSCTHQGRWQFIGPIQHSNSTASQNPDNYIYSFFSKGLFLNWDTKTRKNSDILKCQLLTRTPIKQQYEDPYLINLPIMMKK